MKSDPNKISAAYIEPQTPITIKSTLSNDYVKFGVLNNFPQNVSQWLRESKIQRGIINNKTFFMTGNRFTSENESVVDLIGRIGLEKSFFTHHRNANFDFLSCGNTYLRVVTDRSKKWFKIEHVDYTKCRVNKDHDVVVNPDWTNYNKTNNIVIPLFPKFDVVPNEKNLFHSMIHIKSYEPSFDFYGVPSWLSCLVNARLDDKTDKWNESHVDTGYKTDNIFKFPTGTKDDEIKSVKDAHDEYKNGQPNGFFYLYGDGMEVYPQNQNVFDVDWQKLNNLNIDKLIIGNEWYKSIMSISQATGFDTERTKNDYQLALVQINDRQKMFIDIYKQMFEFFGVDASDLAIYNESIIPNDNPVDQLNKLQAFFTDEQKQIVADYYLKKLKLIE